MPNVCSKLYLQWYRLSVKEYFQDEREENHPVLPEDPMLHPVKYEINFVPNKVIFPVPMPVIKILTISSEYSEVNFLTII